VLATAVCAAADPPILGDWYCAGPFKDKPIGLHRTSFAHVFEIEEHSVTTGSGKVNLKRAWKAEHFLGETNVVRQWEKRADWSDGYLNYLPYGPAPMQNETCYLYRTITAPSPTNQEIQIYARDNIRAWLNGSEIGVAHNPGRGGSSRFAAALIKRVELEPGDNHLFVKITSMHGKHGFSFAMPPYTPSNSLRPGQTRLTPPSDEPTESVKRFRFDVTPIPMYSPAPLKMDEELKRIAETRLGADYTKTMKALKKTVTADVDRGDMKQAAAAIDRFWDAQIKQLPPVAFVKMPWFSVNAIAPIGSRGGSPASICVFDPSAPGREAKVIFCDPKGRLFDMNLSYDAKTLFFSLAKQGVPGGTHIYEIGIDGKNLRQITSGDCSDNMPLLLPGGEIMFVSDRAKTRVVCQNQPAGILYVCNRDGSNVRRVSGNTLSDHSPQIMNDGRVLFSRWDYGVDKNVFCRQNLWTINPDGTGFRLFGSNTKEDPNAFWKARPIPGRPEVVSVFGSHHADHNGMIGLVWDRPVGHGKDFRGEGYRWITREVPSFGDTFMRETGYTDPYPIHEHLFLVAFGGDGEKKSRLYLLDDRGNRKMIYEDADKLGCFYPLPLTPRTRPPVIPSQCKNPEWVYSDPIDDIHNPDEELTGTLLLQDVYEGIGKHVSRGEVKALQVIEQVPKWLYIAPDHQGYGPTIGRGSMYIRRILGNVPVDVDGSAHFVVPAIRDVSFNALDAEGRVIRRMGSTLHVMPGEKQSCVGCHETRGMTPSPRRQTPIAARRPASVPHYPAWTQKGIIDYVEVVQPVFDKHCVSCHSGATPAAALDLSGDKTRFFNMSYDSLLDRSFVDYINLAGTGHEESTAKDRGAIISGIRRHIETDVCVKKPIPLADRQIIYAWIDAAVPYYSTHEVTQRHGIGGRDRWLGWGWFEDDFAPVFNRRCVECHKGTVTPQTYNYNSHEQTPVTSKLWNDLALSQFGFGRYRSAFYGPDHRINLTHPDWSQMLTAPLAKAAGGMQLCTAEDGGAVFKDKHDPDYKLMLAALRKGAEALEANPRVDMPEQIAKLEKLRPIVTVPECAATEHPKRFTWRHTGWISKDATFEASSIDPRWNTDDCMKKFLTGEPFDQHWGVCTKQEDKPWLVIDLQKEWTIAEVDIVNRFPDCRHFARTLTMWISSDKQNWEQVWRAATVADRWKVTLREKKIARYIKLGLREKQYLDLKYVFVYETAEAVKKLNKGG